MRIVLLREFVAPQKSQAITKVFCRVSPLICQDDAVSADIYVEISKFADSMEEPFLKKMLQDFLAEILKPFVILLKVNGSKMKSYVPGSKLPLFPYNRGWSSTQFRRGLYTHYKDSY